MGTNFYFKAKNPRTVEIVDEIHIAKTSCGWRPLFDHASSGCSSVEELKEKYDSGKWKIVDEYGKEYDWAGFDERVLKHMPDEKSHGSPDFATITDEEGYEFSLVEFC